MHTVNRRASLAAGVLASIAMFATTSASAVILVNDNSAPEDVPAISTFQVTGAQMVGMTVRAVFSNGLDETLVWGATGLDSGGVVGTDWGLSQSGDSFDSAWTFDNLTDSLLEMIVLDGHNGFVVFDRSTDANGAGIGNGTANSFLGQDFVETPTFDGIATYSNPVGVGGNAPVGDLFSVLTLDFTANATGGTSDGVDDRQWTFLQDTDITTDSPFHVAEPGTLGLLGATLFALIGARRRTG